ncbi:BlaI/MecI/CopY family transcriptional regulator [Planctomicrobium sp. SH668]|uniref:BlaI/MecI/CopY family transcriptional regulator n=1 Tax=Planctomicrobium sp. SH668 TaxID=3448126 RepID=UPI003F5BBE3A
MSYRLTKCELEVMNVVWQRGAVTVQDVCDGLERPLAYSTVMTTLRILEQKRKALARRKSGRAFVYEPIITRSDVSETLLGDLREHLFGGSLASLVVSLLGSEKISKSDIAEMKAALARLEESE